MIELKDITKKYKYEGGVISALNSVTLSVKKGEFLTIMGASGSGKSTLLHIIGLLDTPDAGRYTLDNKSMLSLTNKQSADLRNQFFGFVFQNYFLLRRETILSNVLLPMYYSRKKIDKSRAISLLSSVGMGERLHSYPSQLSGGQQQCVAIARALIMKPNIILADEPTGNLDSKTGSEVLTILQNLNRQGKTIIMVTHDQNIAQYSKRIVKLRDGLIEDEIFL